MKNIKKMKKSVINSPQLSRLKQQRRRIFWVKAATLLLVTGLILSGLVYLSRIKSFNIDMVSVAGNKVIDTETIESLVHAEMTGNYLWFFPKSNIFLYPRNSIRERLESESKRLKDIRISINKKTLEIYLSEREAMYTWCGEVYSSSLVSERDFSAEQECYYTDGEGYVFEEAPYFSGEVYFKFYGPLELDNSPDVGRLGGAENYPAGAYFERENFSRIVSFTEMLSGIGLTPVAFSATDGDDAKIFLSSKSTQVTGPEIVFKMDSDFEALARNLDVALSTEPFGLEFREKYSSLEYIDLRFGNKVYYKFK